MVPKTTRKTNDTPVSGRLYLACELGEAEWKLGFTIGLGQAPRLKSIKARNLAGLKREIEQAKERFGLAKEAVVLSCYEAGRDGFWLHRYLEANGIQNRVVDSASIEVNRRFRRAKTDRLDVGKLLNMLVRYQQGEQKFWSVVHVPKLEEEDQRQLHRELLALKREQTHHINRMKGLLASQGIVLEVKSEFLEELDRAALRGKVNAWVRAEGRYSGECHRSLDLDVVVRDPADHDRIAPTLDSGDGVHPSREGYRRIAASIPLVGPQIRELMIGGRAIDQPTLIRFYTPCT